MNRPKMLSATFVRNINQPGRYGDGRGGFGLSLLVKSRDNGRLSKTWSQRLRIDGEETNVGLGPWPVVSLKKAREKALENRQLVEEGHDPRERVGRRVPTLAEASEAVLKNHFPTWKDPERTAQAWRYRIGTFVLPKLGRKPIDKVTTPDVLDVLLPVWLSKRETAKRVRQLIGAIMKWAVAQGYRDDNPAGDALGAALPRGGDSGRVQHFKALPHAEVGAAVRKVEESNAWRGTKLAFEFLVLTAARSGEVRKARWEEIDGATWTIPGERMKAGREHRVPLSARALEVLTKARDLEDGSGLVFPSNRSGRMLSDMTISKLIKKLEIQAVPHGFRSSFRDWAAECSTAPREVCELALAHVNDDRTEAAYRRSDLFEKRRELMEDWAAYLGR